MWPPNPMAQVKTWRARDRHTGIGKSGRAPYTYQHVDAPPERRADVYRIETFVPFRRPIPLHRNVYYVPAADLDRFFDGWDQHAETVVDIRPLMAAEAIDELRSFRLKAEGAGDGRA